MAMDARKQRILEAIVALYANGGEPACWNSPTPVRAVCPVPKAIATTSTT